jgi:hypothetical protein
MATLTIPITIEQIRELARQLSPQERQALVDSLLAERFDAVLAESDRRRDAESCTTDEQIQAEIDEVRRNRMTMREERRRASFG